jgi:hypothetical protein
MRPVDQDKFHVKDISRGNCQQAVTASILGLSLDQVPNFVESDDFWGSYHAFLKSLGYIDVELPANHAPDCFYLAYGMSPRGVLHACVHRAGKLVHDPHPSRAGIVVREVHLIVPAEIGSF